MDDIGQKYEESNRHAYDAWGRQFVRNRQVPWEELMPLAALAKPGDRVLDVGCGFGRLYGLLKDAGVSYVGVDQSEAQLDIARDMFPGGTFQVADMAALPFPDASFDMVYCIAALHHLPTVERRKAALQEIARVAKPGAFIVFTNWYLHGPWAQKHIEAGDWQHVGEWDYVVPLRDAERQLLGQRFYHGFTPEELQTLLDGAELIVKEQCVVKERNLITIAKNNTPRTMP